MAKDKNDVDVNEELIRAAMLGKGSSNANTVVASSVTQEPVDKDVKKKKVKQEYETLFINETGIISRYGQPVFIRKEYHTRIQKIVQVIGENKVSLSSYIDNVLTHHFEMFKKEMEQAYDEKNKGIF